MARPNRRQVIGSLAGSALLPALAAAKPERQTDLIKAENDKPGTTDWQLTYIKFDAKAKFRQSLIEGYCDRTSLAAGEKLTVFVSTAEASAVTLRVYRLGCYGGKGGRLVKTFDGLKAKPQPVPEPDKFRLRECRWEPTVSFEIPKDWPSGVYLGKLSCDRHRYESYVTFIVRDDRPADFLFQCSTNTWQAYNKWPDNHSLYDNDRADKRPLVSGIRASFDRPYAKYP